MDINYQLHKNHLTDEPGDYAARVRPNGTVDLEAVITHMVKQKGATAVRGEVLSTLEDFFSAIQDLLAMGLNISTPIANFHLSIRGKFSTSDDSFDAGRHRVVPRVSAGPRLKQAIPLLVEVARSPLQPLTPRPEAYFDAGSDTRDQLLTPRSIGRLTGYYLRFEPQDDPTLGVFLVGAAGETRVTTYSENRPGRLHFLVPELVPGEYRLEVRTAPYGDGQQYRGMLDATLTVAP
jgi:hypothetical protein